MKKQFGVLLLITVLTSCVKEGPIGPAGPKGEPGPQGGPGEGGTASHEEFLFEDITVPAGESAYVELEIPVSKEVFEQSFFHVYAKKGSAIWMQLPNASSGDSNAYRVYSSTANEDRTLIYIMRNRGVGPETFSRVRIIVIPI